MAQAIGLQEPGIELLRLHLTRLSIETEATLEAKLGTIGCEASPMLYGQ